MKHFIFITVLFGCACAGITLNAASSDDELKRSASWNQPTFEQVKAMFDAWLATEHEGDPEHQNDDPEHQKKLNQIWSKVENGDTDDLLRVVALSIAVVNDDAKPLVEFCASPRTNPNLPTFELLNDSEQTEFVRNNLRLFYGQWLGSHQLYNEVKQQLEGLKPEQVVDPATLLFFQAAAHHRLLEKESCLPLLERLLERSDTIPRRYATLARLMDADLAPLKEDSLDEISRMMDNIKVRLGHGRAGKRVRTEEDDVIAKLDKMIEDLEEQAQQMQQQGQGGGQSQQGENQKNAQSNPMQDSVPGVNSGPGNIDKKKRKEDADWGDLPPKEREEALQKLGKDLPSHFRDVIEEYFEKLARDEQ